MTRPPGWKSTKTFRTGRVSKRGSPSWSSATASVHCSPPGLHESRKYSAVSDSMCLIVLAWTTHPGFRLIVATNRDEYFGRPAAPAGFWDDHPSVLAGRDLEAGGTWLGITLDGRFAALTNYRNPADKKTGAPSRGALVSEFLTGKMTPLEYLQGGERRAVKYNGFSLLVGHTTSLYFLSNRGGHVTRVDPGIHGLSNHLLDTPWPKVEKSKAKLAKQLEKPFDAAEAFRLLDDTERAPSTTLPSTGVSLELEERLSAIRILAVGGYGTRCSTALSLGEGGRIEFHERSYREDGGESGKVGYRLTVEAGETRAATPRGPFPPPQNHLPPRLRPQPRRNRPPA